MRYSSLSLKDVICLCADSCDNEAWKEFVSRVERPICLTIMHTVRLWQKPSLSLVEDLRQDTYAKLWENHCRLLRNFAIQHPEPAVLRYLKEIATNVTHDYFKHVRSQTFGGNKLHVSIDDVDIEVPNKRQGSQEKIEFEILLKQIDEHLRHRLTGPDAERDRAIFWFYFRQGWSTKEIASLANTGLTAKGVGSVIERLTRCIREQILGIR